MSPTTSTQAVNAPFISILTDFERRDPDVRIPIPTRTERVTLLAAAPISAPVSPGAPDHWLTLDRSGERAVINMHARSQGVAQPAGPPLPKVTPRCTPNHWLMLGRSDGHPVINMHVRSQCTPLPVRSPAPDFTIRGTPNHWLTLSEFRGRPVVLAFHPANGFLGCDEQLDFLSAMLPQIQKFDAALFGITVDDGQQQSHRPGARRVAFPLLSDCAPRGALARSYGVYRENEQDCESALFLIDRDGFVRWSHVSPDGVDPGASGLLTALDQLEAPNALVA